MELREMAARQYRDQEYMEKLGARIRQLRENRNWSQEHLSMLINMDVRQLGRIERAETNSTISMLKKTSEALGISLSELFDF